MRKYFEAQLRNSTPCDGNALGKVTREQMLETIKAGSKAYPESFGTDPEAYLDHKIKDYQEHKGEKKVYFLGHTAPKRFGSNDSRVSVYSVWESEIDNLSETWVPMDPAMIEDSTMPRFTEKAHYYE